MAEDDGISIKEAYRDYEPPVDAATIVRQLLTSVPDQHLRGLDCIVLTNLSGQPRRHRLGKTTSRGRRVAQSRTAGLYHPRWTGQPLWIELYLDQIFCSYPRRALRIPLIRNLAIADVLYHELGHHVHLFIRPEYREKEDVADEWKKKFTTILIRRRYWYLIPLIRALKMFRRN